MDGKGTRGFEVHSNKKHRFQAPFALEATSNSARNAPGQFHASIPLAQDRIGYVFC